MKTSCVFALALFAVGILPSLVNAQYTNWALFRNCNERPCVIGVAVSTWSQPGWSRVTTFPNEALAWKRACYLHYYDSGHRSPDIEQGLVDCSRY